jgi:arginine-tRNA-protein transferase
MTLQTLRLLMGNTHPCGYLAEREARSAFVDPSIRLNAPLYGALLDQGFRRSGDFAYRPLCPGCRACLPARIVVQGFSPDRAQRRCLRRNADLHRVVLSALNDEHYALYRRYLAARHPAGGMDPEDAGAFREFLGCAWGTCEVWEYRINGRVDGQLDAAAGNTLLAVSVVDRVPRGLSAVYTFFDPDRADRSLGTWAILQQVEWARSDALPYVYLGYWVPGSAKMDYKKNFRPLEILQPSGWSPMPRVAAEQSFTDNARLVNHTGL